MRLTVFSATSFLTFVSAAFAQDTPPNPDVLFILDGSGSMWGRVNEVEKIVVARDVMTGLIEGLPNEIDAGLIAYGHRERGSCSDIELIATPGDTSRTDLLTSLGSVTPSGKTPISGSLLRAGELLRETEEAVSIVLVSDGIESCEGDPCATAALLREQDIDVKIHVVGFDVDAEAEAQLSCIAEAGGGEYHQAGSADALAAALADVRTSIVEVPVVEEPEPTPAPEVAVVEPTVGNVILAQDVLGGVDVVDPRTGETLDRLGDREAKDIPPGTYILKFDYFTSPEVLIEAGEDYVFAAADYGLSVVQLDGFQIGGVNMVIVESDETLVRLAGTTPEQVPPGTYIFEFDNFVSPPFLVEPSQNYVISADDFAPAKIALDGTQFTGVNVVNVATEERLLRLSGTSQKQILPGTYYFDFGHFVSPPFEVEGNGDYTISASDYALAVIAMDGTQEGGVDVINDTTDERIVRLSGTARHHIPAGTYRFEFDNFPSPPFVVEDNGNYTISPADYELATVAMDGAQLGRVDLIDDATGDELTRLSGTAKEQVPPGTYRLKFADFTSPAFTIEPNVDRTLSPTDFGLATVQLEGRISGDFLLLQVGQDPINLRSGRPKQIKPGPYARLHDDVELGAIEIAPNETLVIALE